MPRTSLPSLGLCIVLLALASTGAAGCARCPGAARAAARPANPPQVSRAGLLPAGAETRSLLGRPLYPPPLAGAQRSEREQQLALARALVEARPADLDALIWLGRRTAYLGRYREAVAVFSRGIEQQPDDARLYRHRGHRHLTLRQFDAAVADLERAAALIADRPDEVEPDGLPNPRNVPVSTLHTNVWYHLGVAQIARGDLAAAVRALRTGLAAARTADMRVAFTAWLHLALRRLGRGEEAARSLEWVTADLELLESHAYHQLLLLYRGERSADSLWTEVEQTLQHPGATRWSSIDALALGHGVAAWNLDHARTGLARQQLERIIAAPEWAAFGYIAAEADLARLLRSSGG
jgi:tetratricopeptide (TPR) repeat protein